MILSELAIRRKITFTMIYLIALGFGLFGLSTLKLDLYPDITFPIMGIITQYEGVAPEDIENVITRPIEKAVISVENIKRISSRSMTGTSIIILEFDWGTNMDNAEMDVRRMLSFVEDYLPDDATRPLAFVFDPSMQPILFVTISSDQLGMAELRQLVEEQIEPRLERIPGVATVDTRGGLKRQIRVLLNPVEMAALNVSTSRIIQALRMENLQIPGGLIDEGKNEFSVRTMGEYTNVDQIKNTVIGYSQGRPIYIKNIARVIDGFKEQRQIIRNNGENALMVLINKQSDANTVQTARAVLKELPAIEKRVGQGVKFQVIMDLSKFIVRSISNLRNTAIQAFVLAFFVLFFFLREVRSSLIVAISIPVSIIVTFFVMSQVSISLNIISMAGLALAVGMLVDNAIVVLENIFRHFEVGEDPVTASNNGTSEVSMAIIASTLTTLAVFIPILFVPGIAGVLFNDMSITIVFSLTTSLLVALTLIPLLASQLLKKSQFKYHDESRSRGKLSLGIARFLRNLEKSYVKLLDFSLRKKAVFFAVLIVFLILTVIIFPFVGGEFITKADQSFIRINVERESAASLASMNSTMREIEKIIREEVPEAENVYVSFGTGEDISALFGAAGSNKGEVLISLPDVKERERSQFEIQDVLREKLRGIPGAKVIFDEGRGMPGMSAEGDIAVKIFGFDRNVARRLGDQVAEIMSQVAGVVDVHKSYSMPKPEYQVLLDRARISSYGLTVAQVSSVIESGIKGKVATQYREGGYEYDVVVQLDKPYRDSYSDLANIRITTPTGAKVPLKDIARIKLGEAAELITREDQQRLVTISCTVSGRDLQSVTRDITEELNGVSFPSDFRWEIGGVAEDQMESFRYLFVAILAAIALVYMVMASQFESLLNPFIILFTIPLALMGAVWGLFVSGTFLSITALIGCMLLVGIVVNNGIVLIDYINQLRQRYGLDLWRAILVGGRRRLRPILMTALTTILSMIPLALKLGSGAEIWAPMARAVIGGLTVSTLLTLILIPVLYHIFEGRILKRRIKKGQLEAVEPGRPEDLNLDEIQ